MKTKKILSIVIALAMVCSLGVAAFAADDNWADYQQYVIAFAEAGAPTEDDAASMTEIILACEDMDDISAASDIQVFFEILGALDYDAWVEAGMPEADIEGITAGDDSASGEASDEASGEASGEIDEEAYQQYLLEFVASCEDIQTSGSASEYEELILAGNYTDFPVEMLFDATWWGEAALTYEEFVAAGGDVEVADHPSNGAMLDDAPDAA